MDIEKSTHLQATSDQEPLIDDSFLLNGHLTDVYLYSTEIKIMQKNMTHVIPIDFNLTFSIVVGKEGPIGIELRC